MIGNYTIQLNEIGSTNLFASELLEKDEPKEGTVIFTQNQTTGRGQSNNKWESEPDKNIAMSVILYPNFLKPSQQFKLNQVVSLAVWDAIHDFLGDSVRIKWPNDIYVGRKKICGILIQNSIIASHIQSSIIGIGINVNQSDFSFKLPNPTSFRIEKSKDYDLEEIRKSLCSKLELYYAQLRTRNFTLIDKAYHQRLYQVNKKALYKDINNNIFSGEIVGTTAHGKLNMKIEGKLQSFDLKQVSFL